MRLNVLIADDEYFIRQRLKKIINWDQLDLQFIGEAENGARVIEILLQEQVDILMLDLKMPIKSGLEVCEYIFNHHLKTKIIILSGYNDFEYAQKALKFKVEEYLLKPINKDTLEQSLLSCKKDILASLEKQRASLDYEHYKKRSFLYSVILGSNNLDDLHDKYPGTLEYPFTAFMGLFSPTNHDQCVQQLVEDMGKETIAVEYYKENDSASMIQFLMKDASDLEVISEIVKRFLRRYHNYCFIVLGTKIHISDNWNDNYNLVWNSLYQRYFVHDNLLLAPKNIQNPKLEKKMFLSIRKKLLLYLNSKDISSLNNFLDNLFVNIKKTGSVSYLSLILTELFVTMRINLNNNLNASTGVNNFVQELMDEAYSLDQLKEIVLSYASQCLDNISHTPSHVVLVNKIMDYINEHYKDENLSVSVIADLFEMNSTYLGSIFKKVTGQSIIEYTTHLRIEHAKKLLQKKNYTITQIAEMIGYSDVFYFSKKFKKIVGCSPRDFN